MSGQATRVINRSTGNSFDVFALKQVKRCFLISDCLYFCFTGSLLSAREDMRWRKGRRVMTLVAAELSAL